MREDKKKVDSTFVVARSVFVQNEAEFLAAMRGMYTTIAGTFESHKRNPALVELHVYAAPKDP